MYTENQELTVALSIEALKRAVKAECAYRTMMNSELMEPPLLKAENASMLADAIRHAIGLTILRLADMVKSTDLDSETDIVHLVVVAPKWCFNSELRQVRHIIEDAVVVCVLREWLGFDVPVDSIDALKWL